METNIETIAKQLEAALDDVAAWHAAEYDADTYDVKAESRNNAAVVSAAAALLAARFPACRIVRGQNRVGFGGSTYFDIYATDDARITVRLSDHANTTSQWSKPAANIVAGCTASDITDELDAAAAELESEQARA